MMLLKLLGTLGGTPQAGVISLVPGGALAPRIEALGIPVESPGMQPGALALARYGRLGRMVADSGADLVQCWMYHANLLGGLAARQAGIPVIWGLRQSDLDGARSKRSTIFVAKAGAWFSRGIPQSIVCVSEATRRVHAAMGYDAARLVVIPNGFDLEQFRPDADARASVRAELGLAAEAPLVGLIARFDAQKDHATFLAAAARLVRQRNDVSFALVGAGCEAANLPLARMIADAGLLPEGNALYLLGPRDDMPRLTAALDVAVSSSAFGEGFSNTIGEALATGVPVAATDVGDSAVLVGESGRAVGPGDAEALADAIGGLLDLGPEGRARMGAAARARMARDYALPAIAARYRSLYEDVLASRPGGQGESGCQGGGG